MDQHTWLVWQDEDSQGVRGISLSKDLMGVAGRALKDNICKLAPQILPLSEKLAYLSNLIARKVFAMPALQLYMTLHSSCSKAMQACAGLLPCKQGLSHSPAACPSASARAYSK